MAAASPSPDPWIPSLLQWYREHRRDLPWRRRPTPYRVWISEIMLQQTQVATVVPYFERFVKRFPNVAALAQAYLDEVLRLWEGLGYYQRARHLYQTAQIIAHDRKGRWPRTFEEWRALPGIGRYTAAAIASIAFGEAVPVVDGNVLRLFARLWARPEDIRKSSVRDELFERLCIPIRHAGDPSAFNQALMELGARVCTVRSPQCPECPLTAWCEARRRHQVEAFPVRSRRPKRRHETVGLGLILDRQGRILIARRSAKGLLGGLWEFPGGRRQGREPLAQTVRREVREETGLEVEVGPALPVVRHAYSHFTVKLHPFLCRRVSGQARALAAEVVRWVPVKDLGQYPFPAANRKIEANLHRFLSGPAKDPRF